MDKNQKKTIFTSKENEELKKCCKSLGKIRTEIEEMEKRTNILEKLTEIERKIQLYPFHTNCKESVLYKILFITAK